MEILPKIVESRNDGRQEIASPQLPNAAGPKGLGAFAPWLCKTQARIQAGFGDPALQRTNTVRSTST